MKHFHAAQITALLGGPIMQLKTKFTFKRITKILRNLETFYMPENADFPLKVILFSHSDKTSHFSWTFDH